MDDTRVWKAFNNGSYTINSICEMLMFLAMVHGDSFFKFVWHRYMSSKVGAFVWKIAQIKSYHSLMNYLLKVLC